MTDHEISLVSGAKSGNMKAYEELYSVLYPRLSQLVIKETGNSSVCDTVLKAAFDKARFSVRFLDRPETFEQMIRSLILAECGPYRSKSAPTAMQNKPSVSESAPVKDGEYDPDKASYDYRSSVYATEFSSIEPEPDFNGFMSFFGTGKIKTESSSSEAAYNSSEEEKIKTLVFDTEGGDTSKTLVLNDDVPYSAAAIKHPADFTDDTIKLFLSRRSVKSYTDQPVPKEIIDAVIQAGLYAPSGMGKQSTVIIAVTDKTIRDRLSDLNRRYFVKDIDPFYGAPVVLIVLADKSVPTYLYDGSLTMGNMLLAAHALGVGGCWIHRAKQMFESEEGKALLNALGLTGEYEGIGNCVLGYPAEAPKPAAQRKPNRVFFI